MEAAAGRADMLEATGEAGLVFAMGKAGLLVATDGAGWIAMDGAQNRNQMFQLTSMTYFHQLKSILRQTRPLHKPARIVMSHQSHTRHLMMHQPFQTLKGVSPK